MKKSIEILITLLNAANNRSNNLFSENVLRKWSPRQLSILCFNCYNEANNKELSEKQKSEKIKEILYNLLDGIITPSFLEAAIAIQGKKSEVYQNALSQVEQADYYPRGILSILDIVNAKILRITSILSTQEKDKDYVPNFESLNDSVIDLINYCSFGIAWLDKGIPGQKFNTNILNEVIHEPLELRDIICVFDDNKSSYSIHTIIDVPVDDEKFYEIQDKITLQCSRLSIENYKIIRKYKNGLPVLKVNDVVFLDIYSFDNKEKPYYIKLKIVDAVNNDGELEYTGECTSTRSKYSINNKDNFTLIGL